MDMIERLSWIDMAVQMQYSTMEYGRVRAVVSTELMEKQNDMATR